MPTSAPGRSERARGSSGFTLIEILVVVVLIAVATAASMTLLRPVGADAAREGRQLAVLFERLALEARLSGRPTAWRCSGAQDLQFEMLDRDIGGEATWKPWEVKPSHRLAEGLRISAFELEAQPLDCSRLTLLPVFGLAPEFSFQLEDASGQRRQMVSDVFGRVTLRAVVEP